MRVAIFVHNSSWLHIEAGTEYNFFLLLFLKGKNVPSLELSTV